MRQIAEFVSVLSCALFTGAAVYINLVGHPARMQCGVELAATEFAPSYVEARSCTSERDLPAPALLLRGRRDERQHFVANVCCSRLTSEDVRLAKPTALRECPVPSHECPKVFLAPRLRTIPDWAVLCSQQPKFHALKERRVLEFGSHVHFRKVSPRWAVRPTFRRKSRNASLKAKTLPSPALGFPLQYMESESR